MYDPPWYTWLWITGTALPTILWLHWGLAYAFGGFWLTLWAWGSFVTCITMIATGLWFEHHSADGQQAKVSGETK